MGSRGAPETSVPLTVLRIGSVRFTAFYFLAFYSAVLRLRPFSQTAKWVAIGLVIGAVHCLGIELVNRWADQQEDAVNAVERTAQCRFVGYGRILALAWASFALQLVIYGALFGVYENWRLLVVQLASWVIGLNYSVGLRFKRRRFGSAVVLGATFLLPFLWGHVLFSCRLMDAPAGLLVVPVFVASLAGSKDVTDVEGDRTVGYGSRSTGVSDGHRATTSASQHPRDTECRCRDRSDSFR